MHAADAARRIHSVGIVSKIIKFSRNLTEFFSVEMKISDTYLLKRHQTPGAESEREKGLGVLCPGN